MQQGYGTVGQLVEHVRNQLNCFWPVTELVEKAFKTWLPAPKKFDSFAREEKGSPEESGKTKPITKDNAAKSKKR